ncbi:MAG: hypothetical protein LBN08_00490 [Lactobacillales bacterium]|jgi:hypothetical protein|nr:hypothetical protein [Lactobacillales bacterium]
MERKIKGLKLISWDGFGPEVSEINLKEASEYKNRLIPKLHIDSWEDEYEEYVCDGGYWELKIYYTKGKMRVIHGNVRYPKEWYLLLKILGRDTSERHRHSLNAVNLIVSNQANIVRKYSLKPEQFTEAAFRTHLFEASKVDRDFILQPERGEVQRLLKFSYSSGVRKFYDEGELSDRWSDIIDMFDIQEDILVLRTFTIVRENEELTINDETHEIILERSDFQRVKRTFVYRDEFMVNQYILRFQDDLNWLRHKNSKNEIACEFLVETKDSDTFVYKHNYKDVLASCPSIANAIRAVKKLFYLSKVELFNDAKTQVEHNKHVAKPVAGEYIYCRVIFEGPQVWTYATDIENMKPGDLVVAPFGYNNIEQLGRVLSVETYRESDDLPRPPFKTKMITLRVE